MALYTQKSMRLWCSRTFAPNGAREYNGCEKQFLPWTAFVVSNSLVPPRHDTKKKVKK